MQKVKIQQNSKNRHVFEIILSNPKQLNAMDDIFFAQLKNSFSILEKNDECRVIILKAEGKIFTAGLDLKEAMKTFGLTNSTTKKSNISALQQNKNFIQGATIWQKAITKIEKCKKPVIAAIHGYCIGGGVDVISACDIRLATKNAKFSIRETQVAIVADLGTLQRIGKIVGNSGFVNEMAFTGGDYSAEKWHSVGLLNQLYETKKLLEQGALKLAESIARNSPLVVQGTKRMLRYSREHSTEDSLQMAAYHNALFMKSDDLKEALFAFMKRTTPVFKCQL